VAPPGWRPRVATWCGLGLRVRTGAWGKQASAPPAHMRGSPLEEKGQSERARTCRVIVCRRRPTRSREAGAPVPRHVTRAPAATPRRGRGGMWWRSGRGTGGTRGPNPTRVRRAPAGGKRAVGVGATTAAPGLPESPSKPTRSHGEGKGGTTAERWAAVLVVPPHVPPSAAAHLTSRQKKPLAMVSHGHGRLDSSSPMCVVSPDRVRGRRIAVRSLRLLLIRLPAPHIICLEFEAVMVIRRIAFD
jgi:hypothetical protein